MDVVSFVDEISDSLSYGVPALRVSCVSADRGVIGFSEMLDPIECVLAEHTHFS